MTASLNPNGQTAVALSTELVNALTALNVNASGFGTTNIEAGVASFAITGGAADLTNTSVEIIHSGGLTLRAGTTEVNLTDFVISNLGGQTVLTGLVIRNGEIVTRAPLFNLEIGSIGTSNVRGRRRLENLDIDQVSVRLTETAASALNQAFSVSAFTAGFNIGTAQVDALFNPRTGNIRDRTLPLTNFIDNAPGMGTGMGTAAQDVLSRGRTSVELSDDLVNALGVLNVRAVGFGGTRIRNGVADFLITGGAAELDTTEVEIFHQGGLTFKAGDTKVRLTDFLISSLDNQTVLTGAVVANDELVARIPLFDLQVGGVNATTRQRRGVDITNLDLTNVNVALSNEAATALNRAFNVTAFTAGLQVGTAQVDAFVV